MRSFGDNAIHRRLFRGRDRDKYDLLQLVLAERLVVLFGRSGLGKSSLIGAGLMEPLREKGFFPMVVRINAAGGPLASLYGGIHSACVRAIDHGHIEKIEPDPGEWNKASLWHFFKSLYIWRENEDQPLEPVLIVDQFEELFTLVSEEARKDFIGQLADLVRGTRPVFDTHAGDAGGELGDGPPQVKVVLSIREDFLAHLEEMAERIPAILKTRFRLAPLRREEAARAIVEPAAYVSAELETRPFTWSDDAVQQALDFLCRRISSSGEVEIGNEVEPFQLQLICQRVENLVQARALTTVTGADLGGDDALRGILSDFYRGTLDKLCAEFHGFRLRYRLEKLCEEGLISGKGRRLLREESTIHQSDHVEPEVLAAMVEERLIRKEPRVADNYYELSHDTLIEPILASRNARERRTKRFFIGTGAVVLLAAVSAATYWGVSGERRGELRSERARSALQLAEHGDVWWSLGNGELAAGFYREAARFGEARGLQRIEAATVEDIDAFGSYDATDNVVATRRADAALKKILEIPQRLDAARKNIEALRDASESGEREQLQKVLSALETERNALSAARETETNQLVAVAKRLAARGEVEPAAELFRKGRELANAYRSLDSASTPGRPRRSDAYVTGIGAEELEIADLLARAAYSREAAAMYAVLEMDFPEIAISATSWNEFCWAGGIVLSNPAPVAAGCERAAKTAETTTQGNDDEAGAIDDISGAARDSRGLLKARQGDLDAARRDFEAYLVWALRVGRSEDEIAKRRAWIADLSKGVNPIDARALAALESEERDDVQSAREEVLRMSMPAAFMETSLADLVSAWAASTVVHEQLAASTGLCEGLESEEPDDEAVSRCDWDWENGALPGMEALQSNACSWELKDIQSRFPALAEIFATDSVGGNACVSNKTSDYFQRDESWWKDAELIGRAFNYDYDLSANQSSVSVSVSVRNRQQKLLGVMKAVFKLASLGRRTD